MYTARRYLARRGIAISFSFLCIFAILVLLLIACSSERKENHIYIFWKSIPKASIHQLHKKESIL